MEAEQTAPTPAAASVTNMKTSEKIDLIVGALVAVQAAIKNPEKNQNNAHFNSKYADLAGGLNVIRPALSAQSCALLQVPRITGGGAVVLDTRIVHTSGQWIEGEYPVCSASQKHQDMGSAMNYAKRQSAFAMVGIAGEDDDDDGAAGNSANEQRSARGGQRSQPRTPARSPADAIEPMSAEDSKATADKMLAEIKGLNSRDEDLKWVNDNSSKKKALQPPDGERVSAAFAEHKRSRAAQQKEAA